MHDLATVAPPFVEMAHRIVWCSAATVDTNGRPRTRVLHPIWEWDGTALTGWIATDPRSPKRRHLEATPYMACNYWTIDQDTCLAECRVTWHLDDETRADVWRRFAEAPEPVGYDPSIIPGWDSPTSPAFAALRLEPLHLRVLPGSLMLSGEGELLEWRASADRR